MSNSTVGDMLGQSIAVVELPQEASHTAANSAMMAQYHSELAMAAARKMRRTRQKRKTGQVVCHHLRMMLTSEPETRSVSAQQGQQGQAPQYSLSF